MKDYIYPARLSPLTHLFIKKEENKVTIEELQSKVVNTLVSEHDFDIEEAASVVETSIKENEDMWNENAEPSDLAKYLADGDDD